MASAAIKGLTGKRFWNVAAMPHAAPYRRPEMSTEPGGLVETSDDGTLLHFIDLDRRRQGRLRKLVEVTFAFDVREHVLAGEGHFANVQVPENVNPLLGSARGIPKNLVPHR